tara:strand:- start:401 stop:607 length:207 start_codon:yes stop_codon:yes gene_type:complete
VFGELVKAVMRKFVPKGAQPIQRQLQNKLVEDSQKHSIFETLSASYFQTLTRNCIAHISHNIAPSVPS